MRLVIGGYAQGKLEYVFYDYEKEACVVAEGVLPSRAEVQRAEACGKRVIINRLQEWVKERILHGGCPEREILEWLEECGDCVVICDEVGNGIVPVEAFEREYRESVGRVLIELAKKAETVERVVCGIGQRIK